MKKIVSFIFLLIFFFQINLVNATGIYSIEVNVNEKGGALVRDMFSIDSRNMSSFFLPSFSPKSIKAYDEKGALNYSVSNGIYVNLHSKDKYSFTVEYSSDVLTSKNASEWTFHYDYYKVGNFNDIKYTLILPSNALLYSFFPEGTTYSENDHIHIVWDIPNEISSETIEAKYGFKPPPNEIKKSINQYPNVAVLSVSIVIILIIISLLFKKIKFKSKFKEDFSPGQKDLIHTLTENERKIIRELFNKKELTQKKISLLTGIPKSTLSRTLKRLEMKNFIEVRDYGNTKIIKLTDWFLEK